jgi:hypothetical protein
MRAALATARGTDYEGGKEEEIILPRITGSRLENSA